LGVFSEVAAYENRVSLPVRVGVTEDHGPANRKVTIPSSISTKSPKVNQESAKFRSAEKKNWWEKIMIPLKKAFLGNQKEEPALPLESSEFEEKTETVSGQETPPADSDYIIREETDRKVIRSKPKIPASESESLSMSWKYFEGNPAEWLALVGDVEQLTLSPLDLHTVQEISRLRQQYGDVSSTDLQNQKKYQNELQTLIIRPQDLEATQIYKHLKGCDCKAVSLEELPLDEKIRSYLQYKKLNLQNVFLFYEEEGGVFAAVNFYYEKEELKTDWRVMSRMISEVIREEGRLVLRLSAPAPQYALGYYLAGMVQQGWCP